MPSSKNTYMVGIRSVSDYSPFGVELEGRTQSGGGYRYSFQGQEKDDEVKGEGNSINYKYRMHDPRVGRFFAVDPLARDYPHNGSYNYSENRVVDSRELEGMELLDSDEALFYIKNGITFLRLENISSETTKKHLQEKAQSDSFEGPDGQQHLGAIPTGKMFNMQMNISSPSEGGEPTIPSNQKPPEKVSPNPNKSRPPHVSPPAGGRGASLGIFVINLVNEVAFQRKVFMDASDNSSLKDQQTGVLNRAIKIVNAGILNGDIEREYLNIESISQILNVVLTGEVDPTNTSNIEFADRAAYVRIGEQLLDKYNTTGYVNSVPQRNYELIEATGGEKADNTRIKGATIMVPSNPNYIEKK